MNRVDPEAFRALNDESILKDGVDTVLALEHIPAALRDRLLSEADEWRSVDHRSDRLLARAWLSIDRTVLDFLALILYDDRSTWSRRTNAALKAGSTLRVEPKSLKSDQRKGVYYLQVVAVLQDYDFDFRDSPAAWRSRSALDFAQPGRVAVMNEINEWLLSDRSNEPPKVAPLDSFIIQNAGTQAAASTPTTAESTTTKSATASLSSVSTPELAKQLKVAKKLLFDLQADLAAGALDSFKELQAAKSTIRKTSAELNKRTKKKVSVKRSAIGFGGSKTRYNERLVVPNASGGWDVLKNGGLHIAAHFESKEDAVNRAKQIVRNSGRGNGRVRIDVRGARPDN